jgi:hypothetical protein
MANLIAWREEKQILRSAQDDMSRRGGSEAQRSEESAFSYGQGPRCV